MRSRLQRCCTLSALLLAVTLAPAARREGGESSIRDGELRRHVGYLASDEMMGRDTGSAGIARAEEYIAKELRGYGLKPLPGHDDFFLDFTLYADAYDLAGTSLEIELGERVRKGEAGSSFRPFPFTDEGEVEAPIVFAGYGITDPTRDYDDYDSLDVEGKLVLVLRHEPLENDPDSSFDGTSSTEHAFFENKAQNAREHGAAGMLLVTDPLHHDRTDDLRLGGSLSLEARETGEPTAPDDEAPQEEEAGFLSLHIDRDLADAIVGAGELSLEDLQRELDRGTPAADLPPLLGVRGRVSVTRRDEQERVAARNVAAFLPGRDPELRDEWIVIGAHHDHVGGFEGKGDTVFNGADDNASGTAAVLELAEAFARGEAPRRSIVFTTFSAEERGLLGSRAMVESGQIPVERVVFMLNLDMLGRNPSRPIEVGGDGFGRGVREAVERSNADGALDLEFGGKEYSGNSDHDAFYEADIPFVFLFTGTHDDYHQLGDHPHKLSYRRMQRIGRMAYRLVDEVGNADRPPAFVHHVGWLGAQVEAIEGEARVTAVDEDSRAAQAGVREGDVVLSVGEQEVRTATEIGPAFRAVEPGQATGIELQREGEPVAISVTRAKTGYLGVFPGAVDDDLRQAHGLHEGQGIAVRGTAPEGPMDLAGVRAGDVLIAMAGKPIGLAGLRGRLAQIGAGETISIEVLRDGERLDLELTLGERPERR